MIPLAYTLLLATLSGLLVCAAAIASVLLQDDYETY